jgi:hypothetical protein
MIRTDRTVFREDPAVLDGLAAYAGPVMVLYASMTSSAHPPA